MSEDMFGLSEEARYYIDSAAERAADRVIDKLSERDCPADCEDMRDLKDTVYGNGSPGLKTRTTRLEEQVANLVWWNRATIVSALGAVGAVIVSLVKG